jgi:hypothetical protein
MRRPGGYGQIIADEPNKASARDCYGRRIAAEADSYVCGHCDRVMFVNAGEQPEDIGGLCKACMTLICPHCLNVGHCTPLEKRLAEQEARYHALRSYGLL